VRYWTVVDDEYRVVGAADGYLQHLRLGQDAAESTTKAYAEALALYLRWCERTSRDWRTAAGRLGGFITWLRHTPGDPDAPASGPGLRDVRGAARINRILAVVRGFIRHQVAIGDGRVIIRCWDSGPAGSSAARGMHCCQISSARPAGTLTGEAI
jgi:hypothetical protein